MSASREALSSALTVTNIKSAWRRSKLFLNEDNELLSMFVEREDLETKSTRFSIANKILTDPENIAILEAKQREKLRKRNNAAI